MTTTLPSIHDKFTDVRTALCGALIEREEEIDLCLTALIAQEHVLLTGPPGTGKSMLADALVKWMHGSKFSLQINKFTVPEEVFGPISLSGLKADRYARITTGKMPEADVVFIDEIFKASSAILNTMLQILNERTFRNDNVLVHCPLKLCVAASNEWPGEGDNGKELGALFDRFLFRKLVRPIGGDKGLHKLLWTDDLTPAVTSSITPAEIDIASQEAALIPFGQAAQDAFTEIHRDAKREGIIPGDRRLRKSIKAARSFAWLQNATEVEPDHLEVLGHVLWDDPAEQPRKLAEIVGRVANPTGMQVNGLLMEAQEVLSKVDMKNLQEVGLACKKLAEVEKTLRSIPGTRSDNGRDFIKAEVHRLKQRSVELM